MPIACNILTVTKTAHTEITSQGCELIMSVSSARLTAMQTNAGNLSSQNQEKGPVWREHRAELEEHPGQTVTHDGRPLCVETDMTSRCFTHFPVSVASGGLERRGNKDTPPPALVWRLTAPFNVGVD